MGANAQATVPTFTAAQVLTADQMNQSARTGVPVFADTTARDAAFGGTGEKVLAEGQLCYVENLTGVAQIQYYDGAAWVSLAAGGLAFVTSQSFSAVSSVSVNNCFTSTYTNYFIIYNNSSITTSAAMTMRLRASSTDNSSANYNWVGFYQPYSSGSITTQNGSGATSFTVGWNNTAGSSGTITLRDPQTTAYTAFQSFGYNLNSDTNNYGGNMTVTTSYDGFTLLFGSNCTGVVAVYGYAKS